MSSELSNLIEFDKTYELNIGKSFQNAAKSTYHQFKYDFTPASIDKNQEAKVSIGTRNDVTILVPHVEGSAQKHTQFAGNTQKSTNKECILVYDTRTKEFTLERLTSNFNLKKSRLEGSSKAQMITPRSITPTNENTNKKKKPDNNTSTSTPSSSQNTSISSTSTPADLKKPGVQQALPNKNRPTKELTPPPKINISTTRDEILGDLNLSDDGSDDEDL